MGNEGILIRVAFELLHPPSNFDFDARGGGEVEGEGQRDKGDSAGLALSV